jgi:hypothetical protein
MQLLGESFSPEESDPGWAIQTWSLIRQAFFWTPHSQRDYGPLAALAVELGHEDHAVKNYAPSLDLETAITTVRYEQRGVTYKREAFAIVVDRVLVIQIESLEKTQFTIRLTRVSEHEYETNEFVDLIKSLSDGLIALHATPGGRKSNELCCVTKVQC